MMRIGGHTDLRFWAITIVLLTIFVCPEEMLAQQDAQYTQYLYNTVSVNPAYAGSRGNISIGALHRSQWVGLDGAPSTQTFNVHSPVGYNGIGLGFSLVRDAIGPTSETNFDIDFSYTLLLTEENKLSFGLKGSANLLDIRFSELNQDVGRIGSTGMDPTLQFDIQNRISPNFGAGVYYHNEKFYAGISVPRILETQHFDESSLSTAREQLSFYGITGYVFELNPLLKFKPTLLTKFTQGAPLQVDVSANFLLREKFSLGLGYRWSAAFTGLFGFQISNEMFVGLAYDRETTELGAARFNNGSFEVVLRYDFARLVGNIKTPRFF